MSTAAYFVQECPTCGRSLQVRVAYLGKQIVCQHCSAQFEAFDPESDAYPPSDSGLAILRRAEELLQRVESREAARTRLPVTHSDVHTAGSPS